MTWPRLWRLFVEPLEGTTWELDGEWRRVRSVWHMGIYTKVLWSPVPQSPTDLHHEWPIAEWRRWWVWAREVRP